jgi:uncharacterized protein
MVIKPITMFKKYILLFVLVLSGCLAFAQDFPEKSNTLVTDYTNTLTPEQKQSLEDKLVAFDDSSSTQIAVVIIKSVGDYDINEYGTQLGRKWGIGQAGKNNGVLLLVALNDHKLTIQTGYGVEGALPDVVAQEIRQNDINPRFRAGDYYGGLDAGVDQIIKYTKGEYKSDKKHKGNGDGGPAGFIIIVVIVILIAIFSRRGGGGQVIGSRGGASPFWWMLAGSMLNSGNRGGGGGWGGGSGGSGGGGGGFGGFGGGSFGGGGSGGSW